MENIYEDIAARTGGDIYIGVVGPVRTGKSTFIKRFMDQLVIPGISDPYRAERARDELPQSGLCPGGEKSNSGYEGHRKAIPGDCEYTQPFFRGGCPGEK